MSGHHAPIIGELSINPGACIIYKTIFFIFNSLKVINRQLKLVNLSRMPDGLSQIWDDPSLFFGKRGAK
jgi:hypothetical protein